MKDYGFLCGVCNTVIYIILFMLSIVIILNIFEMIVVRGILIIISFILCGYIEEKIVSKYIKEFVEYILQKNN